MTCGHVDPKDTQARLPWYGIVNTRVSLETIVTMQQWGLARNGAGEIEGTATHAIRGAVLVKAGYDGRVQTDRGCYNGHHSLPILFCCCGLAEVISEKCVAVKNTFWVLVIDFILI